MRAHSTITLFAAALSLYLAPFAVAAEVESNHAVRSLNDQNLFEAHLQAHAETSHKRLPSEVLTQQRRDEQVAHPSTTAVPASSTSTSPSSSPSSSNQSQQQPEAKRNIPFSARQPSHFIKHSRSRKLGKRRLASSSSASASESDEPQRVIYERDSDDLEAVWSMPAVVSQILGGGGNEEQQQEDNEEAEQTTSSSPSEQSSETVASSLHADASAKLAELEHSTLAALQAFNQRLLPKLHSSTHQS